MPNSERIETLISPEALKQFEQLKSVSDANTASFEKLIAKAVELNKAVGNATTFKEINKATKEMADNESALAKQVDELAKANAKLQALFDQQAKKIKDLSDAKKKQRDDDKQGADAVAKAEEKLINSYSAEARKLAELREQQTLVNKANKQSAQETLGLSGAYKQLEQQYNKAAQEAKDLAVQFGAESKQAKEASARALELDARLKAADANTGKFNRNVGNYSGALNTLQKALQEVSKRIEDNTKAGIQNEAVMEALQKEQGLLVSLVDAQSKGFANATSEIRNNQQAILLLSQIYGEDSDVITELTKKTAKLSNTVGDMKATIKAQASDTHVFDGLLNAAQTLAGVYGIAQGAAALFGDENEELQKTFVKLQAVTTILSGLQGIQNALQKESAIRLLITSGIEKVKLAQKYLETAAESKNIVVKYAAVAAQKALNFATSAAGGPILLLIGLLATAFISMAAYGEATEDATKKNERLSKSLERTNTAIDKSSADIKTNGDKVIAALEDQFANEESLRFQREQNLQEEIENLKKFNSIDAKNREDAIRNVARLTSGKVKQDKEVIAEAIKVRDGYLANLQKQTDKENELEIVRLQNSRSLKEEVIKAKQDEIEAQKTQLQTSLQLQQNIASNERKTQKERINALQEAEKIQERLIEKDANSKLLNPTLTPSQIKVIEAQRAAALTQARRESNKAIEDLNRSYAERERKARFDIIKTEIEDQIKADDIIVQNEKNGFDKRMDALYDGYTKRRDIIIAQHDLDIKNDTLTTEERLAIEKKYTSDINGLTVEYGLQQLQLYQQNQDKVNEIIEKGLQARKDLADSGAAKQKSELIKQLVDGNITVDQFNKQKDKAERDARIISIKAEIDDLSGKKAMLVMQHKEQSAEFIAIDKALNEKQEEFRNANFNKEIEAAQKLADIKKQIATEAFSLISDLQSAQFDKEIAQVQAQMDEVDRKAERDKIAANLAVETEEEKQARLDLMQRTGITASEALQQEKANRIAKIEAIAQNQRENLERRQRQLELEKARFEKAANIARIISDTASAVVAALGSRPFTPANIALASAVGTLGAIQLAKAIATPLPKFEHGTDDAPGGLALVGEKRRELIITPQGQVTQTPSVPTVMNVPRHSIVLPDARAALESGLAVNKQGRLVQQENNNFKIEQKLDTIAKAIKNKPVLNMSANQSGLTAIWNYGANWSSYTEDQTRF
jgi:hypothetical protein